MEPQGKPKPRELQVRQTGSRGGLMVAGHKVDIEGGENLDTVVRRSRCTTGERKGHRGPRFWTGGTERPFVVLGWASVD